MERASELAEQAALGPRRGREERRGEGERSARGKGKEMGGAIGNAIGIRMGIAVRSEERDGMGWDEIVAL
jgi:hypothetical protein